MTARVLIGDCRAVLKTLESDSIHSCVTSPPYYGLRSYLPDEHPNKHLEIGSEPTLQQWVDTMVEVFREVRRVLRPDGTLWLNLGDSYATGTAGDRSPTATGKHGYWENAAINKRINGRDAGLKPKDLMGQPWRVAFALQADGWWLRQEIIWSKPNPMPESVRDRCTKAHEHVFLLSKAEKYFFNFEAMQEPVSANTHARLAQDIQNQVGSTRAHAGGKTNGNMKAVGRVSTGVGFGHGYDKNVKPRALASTPKAAENVSGSKQNESFQAATAGRVEQRNARSVWAITTHGFKGAHFATFPPELASRCITAGCPEGGTVIDPFGGSGTVGMVADRQHKHAVLIDLDERNAPMATDRIVGDAPLFAEVTA